MTIVARGRKGQRLSEVNRRNARVQNRVGVRDYLVLDQARRGEVVKSMVIRGPTTVRVSRARPLSKRAQVVLDAWRAGRGEANLSEKLLRKIGGEEELAELLREISDKQGEFPMSFKRFVRLYFK